MSYLNTFIKVADDCPVEKSQIPVAKMGQQPAHLIQYDLLVNSPYTYDHRELIYEVFIRHKEIDCRQTDPETIKKALFSKGQPCLRASALMKRYGFGAHYNEVGKIALYPVESPEYQSFLTAPSIQVIPAMRNQKQSG